MPRDIHPTLDGQNDEPKVPPRGERLHKATYARDKRNPGKYLVRVEGPTAAAFAGRVVPVERMDNSESLEKLTVAVWAGVDDKSQKPVALYHFEQRERDKEPDALPF